MGTEHRTIMRSTEKENFLDHIKNLAFGRGQPLPLALWDPKTKRFTISILIQQLKICHASLAWCSLICCQPNAISSGHIEFCILRAYSILYIASRLYCLAFTSCSGDFKQRMNQGHVTTIDILWITEKMWFVATLFSSQSRVDVEYQKNLSICGIEGLRTGFFSGKGWRLQHGVHIGK